MQSTLTGGNGTAQAVYLENGPDNVSITQNEMKNVSSARSAKGVTIGDSSSANPSQNVLIEDNLIENITSAVRGSCIGGNVPDASSQCKNNGWMTSVRADGSTFKNQGDCIQYVNTGK
jgi:hypothetical protein